MQIDSFLSPCTELKSRWIKDLHLKSDTLKLYLVLSVSKTEVTADAGEDVEKNNIPPLLVILQDVTTTLEISLAAPQKIGHS